VPAGLARGIGSPDVSYSAIPHWSSHSLASAWAIRCHAQTNIGTKFLHPSHVS
jgi:hypothetical protein